MLIAGTAAVVAAVVAVPWASEAGRNAQFGQSGELRLAPAADYLVDAFERFPLVAFSEPGHGAGGTREFIRAVLHHAKFAGTVDDIVVEFGNARYQQLADRYIAGESVPRDELKQIWENTTIVTGIWTAPVFEGILDDVRALNASLPPSRRVRVLLGDPPIDWATVRSPADEDMNDWRDAHFAWIVEEHVMKRGRRAFLWIGGAHLTRKVMLPESVIHLLDSRFPGQTWVAVALDRSKVGEPVVRRLGAWPSLMAAPVRDTWLGSLDAQSDAGMGLSTGTIEENIDAAIFWEFPPGFPDESPRIDESSPFGVELRRRQELAAATIPFRGGAIRFELGTGRIMERSDPALTAIVAELERDAALTLLVKGFTDPREEDSVRLSVERARAVVDWLVERGISMERLEPRGCGSARALWFGQTVDQRAANRRAELVRASSGSACTPPAAFDFR